MLRTEIGLAITFLKMIFCIVGKRKLELCSVRYVQKTSDTHQSDENISLDHQYLKKKPPKIIIHYTMKFVAGPVEGLHQLPPQSFVRTISNTTIQIKKAF